MLDLKYVRNDTWESHQIYDGERTNYEVFRYEVYASCAILLYWFGDRHEVHVFENPFEYSLILYSDSEILVVGA